MTKFLRHLACSLLPNSVGLKNRISVCGLMMNVRSSIRATLSLPKIDLEQALELIYYWRLECKQSRLGLTLKDGKQTFVCTVLGKSIWEAYQVNLRKLTPYTLVIW